MSLLFHFRTAPTAPVVALDPANKNNDAFLTNQGLTIYGLAGSNGQGVARATLGRSTGKFSFQTIFRNWSGVGGQQMALGLIKSTEVLAGVGNSGLASTTNANKIAIPSGGPTSTLDTIYNGTTAYDARISLLNGSNLNTRGIAYQGTSVLTIHVDLDNKIFYYSVDGVLYGDQDPSVNRGYSMGGVAGDVWHPAATSNWDTSTQTVEFSKLMFPIAGFKSWAGGNSAVALDPVRNSTWSVLSNSNIRTTTIGAGAANPLAGSTTSKSSGKWAFEEVRGSTNGKDTASGQSGFLWDQVALEGPGAGPVAYTYGTPGQTANSNIDVTAGVSMAGYGDTVYSGGNIVKDLTYDLITNGYIGRPPYNVTEGSVITHLIDLDNLIYYVKVDGIFAASQSPAALRGISAACFSGKSVRAIIGTGNNLGSHLFRAQNLQYPEAGFQEWAGVANNFLYRGASSRTLRYRGIRTDANMYKGVRGIGWV